MPDIIVIGGGAAGMMSALTAAESGANVLLLERNEKLGKKVYITGKGRCNVTNDCTIDEFMQQVPRNPRFLFSALNHFSPQDMIALLENAGCPTVVQRGRRVYPASEKASDINRTIERLLRLNNVTVKLHCGVKQIITENQSVKGIITDTGEKIDCKAVILATGGVSYPSTGSTGDGYFMSEQIGHTIVPPSPVLSAMETVQTWPCELQGISLRNVTLSLKNGKKKLYTQLGEMLFTHFGISGPLVLEMSCHLPADFSQGLVQIDLKPGLDMQQLDARLQREFSAQSRKQLRNVMPALLPGRLAELFPSLCGIDSSKTCDQITKSERDILCLSMKELPLHLKKARPIEEAIVTRGGITAKEINPGTMESKLINGLFFAGEVIDVDAHTGGYNLQIAWSTGRLAGVCAAESIH